MDLVADLRPQSCPISSVVGTKRYQQQFLVSVGIASEVKQSRKTTIQHSPTVTCEVKEAKNIAWIHI